MFDNGFQPKCCRSGHDFERWTQGVLRALGFNAKLTGGNDRAPPGHPHPTASAPQRAPTTASPKRCPRIPADLTAWARHPKENESPCRCRRPHSRSTDRPATDTPPPTRHIVVSYVTSSLLHGTKPGRHIAVRERAAVIPGAQRGQTDSR